MQSELKPCPFCGGAAECDSRQAFRAMSSGKIRDRFAIYCTSCNADMGFCYDDIESCNHDAAVDQTIAAWNARASDAEITRLTEALRLQMEAKHKEAEEARLWFSKAQEWKEALRAAEEREKGLLAVLGEICSDSNPDWTERRVYPDDALDDIHKIAVEAFYGVKI